MQGSQSEPDPESIVYKTDSTTYNMVLDRTEPVCMPDPNPNPGLIVPEDLGLCLTYKTLTSIRGRDRKELGFAA